MKKEELKSKPDWFKVIWLVSRTGEPMSKDNFGHRLPILLGLSKRIALALNHFCRTRQGRGVTTWLSNDKRSPAGAERSDGPVWGNAELDGGSPTQAESPLVALKPPRTSSRSCRMVADASMSPSHDTI
jgi:hypothetical protein